MIYAFGLAQNKFTKKKKNLLKFKLQDSSFTKALPRPLTIFTILYSP